MRLIIAGGRDYTLSAEEWSLLFHFAPTEIVSGGATGVDKCGEEFAAGRNIPCKVFKADWDAHGKAAGPIRNRQMAEYADAVALFRGGRGTDSMYREAKRAGIKIYDYRSL